MAINDKVRYKHVAVNPASSGSNVVIAAITGSKIKVLGAFVIAAAANTIYFTTASTAITAQMSLAVNGGFTLPVQGQVPYFETVAGEALNVNLSASTAVGITLIYKVEA